MHCRCANIEVIDWMVTAHGIGVDTKWRTRMDKGCVQAIGAFKQQFEPKDGERRRMEFNTGYVGHEYRVVTIAIANHDNYWCARVKITHVVFDATVAIPRSFLKLC